MTTALRRRHSSLAAPLPRNPRIRRGKGITRFGTSPGNVPTAAAADDDIDDAASALTVIVPTSVTNGAVFAEGETDESSRPE